MALFRFIVAFVIVITTFASFLLSPDSLVSAQICVKSGGRPSFMGERVKNIEDTAAKTVQNLTKLEHFIAAELHSLEGSFQELGYNFTLIKARVEASEHWDAIESALAESLRYSNMSSNATEVLWLALNATIAREAQLRQIDVDDLRLENGLLKERLHSLEKGAAEGVLVTVSCPSRAKFDFEERTCVCDEGYTGYLCSQPICDSCEYGTCSSLGNCVCDRGYSGVNCSEPVCSFPCKNGGTCVAPEVCGNCDEGFSGSDCSKNFSSAIRLLRDQSALASGCPSAGVVQLWMATRWGSVCSDSFGFLEAQVACRMAGYDSAVTVVTDDRFVRSVSSSALDDSLSVYADRFSCRGNESSLFDCAGAQYLEHHSCSSQDARVSVVCSPCTFDCPGGCNSRGKCIGDDQCSCDVGYTGPRCESAVCSLGCQNGGVCVRPEVCSCEEGFAGLDCSIPLRTMKNYNASGLLGRAGGGDTRFFLHPLLEPSPICEGVPFRASNSTSSTWPILDENSASPVAFDASSLCRAMGFEGTKASLDPVPQYRQRGQVFPLLDAPFSETTGLSASLLYLRCDACVSYRNSSLYLKSAAAQVERLQSSVLDSVERNCSYHGKIVGSSCECKVGWGSQSCDQPLCPDGCSGHGVCILPSLCSCADGYRGKSCEVSDPLAFEGREALFSAIGEEGLKFGIVEQYYHPRGKLFPIKQLAAETARSDLHYVVSGLCDRLLPSSKLLRFGVIEGEDIHPLPTTTMAFDRWIESSSFVDAEDLDYVENGNLTDIEVNVISCVLPQNTSELTRRRLCNYHGEARFHLTDGGSAYVMSCICDTPEYIGDFCDYFVDTLPSRSWKSSAIAYRSPITSKTGILDWDFMNSSLSESDSKAGFCVPRPVVIKKFGKRAYVQSSSELKRAAIAEAICVDLKYSGVLSFFEEDIPFSAVEEAEGVWVDSLECDIEIGECSRDLSQFSFQTINPASPASLDSGALVSVLFVQCDCVVEPPKALYPTAPSHGVFTGLNLTLTTDQKLQLKVNPAADGGTQRKYDWLSITIDETSVPLTFCNAKSDRDNFHRVMSAVKASLQSQNVSLSAKTLLLASETTEESEMYSPVHYISCPASGNAEDPSFGLETCFLYGVVAGMVGPKRLWKDEKCSVIELASLSVTVSSTNNIPAGASYKTYVPGITQSDGSVSTINVWTDAFHHSNALDAPLTALSSCRDFSMNLPSVRGPSDILLGSADTGDIITDAIWSEYGGIQQRDGWTYLRTREIDGQAEPFVRLNVTSRSLSFAAVYDILGSLSCESTQTGLGWMRGWTYSQIVSFFGGEALATSAAADASSHPYLTVLTGEEQWYSCPFDHEGLNGLSSSALSLSHCSLNNDGLHCLYQREGSPANASSFSPLYVFRSKDYSRGCYRVKKTSFPVRSSDAPELVFAGSTSDLAMHFDYGTSFLLRQGTGGVIAARQAFFDSDDWTKDVQGKGGYMVESVVARTTGGKVHVFLKDRKSQEYHRAQVFTSTFYVATFLSRVVRSRDGLLLAGADWYQSGVQAQSGVIYIFRWNEAKEKYDDFQYFDPPTQWLGKVGKGGMTFARNGTLFAVTASKYGELFIYTRTDTSAKFAYVQTVQMSKAEDVDGHLSADREGTVFAQALPKADDGVLDRGVVVIVRWNGVAEQYQEVQVLSYEGADDYYRLGSGGLDLDSSGNFLVVSSPSHDSGRGAAFFYRYNATANAFDRDAILTPPSTETAVKAFGSGGVGFSWEGKTLLVADDNAAVYSFDGMADEKAVFQQ